MKLLLLHYKTLMFCLICLGFQQINAQCPSGHITLNSQADIDNFISTYPDCTETNGNFQITSTSGYNDVSDISGLNLQRVNGNLTIQRTGSLNSLAGLENLNVVTDYITINDNQSLTSISGLNNLNTATVSSITISSNPVLNACAETWVCCAVNQEEVSTSISNNAEGCECLNDVLRYCTSCPLENPLPAEPGTACNATEINSDTEGTWKFLNFSGNFIIYNVITGASSSELNISDLLSAFVENYGSEIYTEDHLIFQPDNANRGILSGQSILPMYANYSDSECGMSYYTVTCDGTDTVFNIKWQDKTGTFQVPFEFLNENNLLLTLGQEDFSGYMNYDSQNALVIGFLYLSYNQSEAFEVVGPFLGNSEAFTYTVTSPIHIELYRDGSITQNEAPSVNAGNDISINLPQSSVQLSSTSSDDGAVIATNWSQISGPNTAQIETPLGASTNVNGLILGSYTFLVTVTDNLGLTGFDDVQVTVLAEGTMTTWYQDNDGDGYGNAEISMETVNQPEGYVEDNTDCNDADAAINPGATEIPGNDTDENCDGIAEQLPDGDGDGIADVDDNCPSIANANQEDIDNDGIGDACDDDIDGDGVLNAVDCHPYDAAVGAGSVWYADADGDGFGDAAVSMTACAQPEGYVANDDDCNDADAAINPGASEIPGNDIDENCDGVDEQLPDGDGDGIADVDDNCPSIANANQEDIDNDGIGDACDDDIDGDGVLNAVDCDPYDAAVGAGSVWYADADGDGFGDASVSITACAQPEGYVANDDDCDDQNAEINPDATEIPNDGIDQDCDGEDLVEVEDCPVPTGIEVHVVNRNNVTFNDVNGTAGDLYDIESSANPGFVPTGTPNWNDVTMPFRVPFALANNWTYEFYARKDCGELISDWAGPFQFTVTPGIQVIISPNPAVDRVAISGMQVSEISIFDQHGRLVLSTETSSNEFNVSKLQSGIYTIQIKGANGEISVQQLIKK